MDKETLLNLYLEKLRLRTIETIETKELSVLEALKEALIYIEGEMTGY